MVWLILYLKLHWPRGVLKKKQQDGADSLVHGYKPELEGFNFWKKEATAGKQAARQK